MLFEFVRCIFNMETEGVARPNKRQLVALKRAAAEMKAIHEPTGNEIPSKKFVPKPSLPIVKPTN
jgi:hypothetical protein